MNQKEWKSLLRKARKGDSEAQCDVGVYYQEGYVDLKGRRIIPRDPVRAVQWYRLSAEQGNSIAQNQLGVCLSLGLGASRNFPEAISWTKKALKLGESSAAHNLATIYRDMGQLKKAFEFYDRAVALGHMDSLLEVGLTLYYGVGVKADRKAACKCFRKITIIEQNEVAQSTREDAFYMLGVAYLEGTGVKRSVVKARALFEKANKDEDHGASKLLLLLTGRNWNRK